MAAPLVLPSGLASWRLSRCQLTAEAEAEADTDNDDVDSDAGVTEL